TIRISLRLLALASLFVPVRTLATPIDPANPPEGLFIDEWFIIEMAGGKAGHGHSTVTREGDHITSRMEIEIRIRRGPADISVSVDQKTHELLDGTPVSFDNTNIMATKPVRTRGKIKDGEIKIREEQSGVVTSKTYKFDPEAKMSW